jgi:hypothetical protein
MRRARLLPLIAAAALFLGAGSARALEEVSLLTNDGTLHDLRSGTAIELGVDGNGIRPDSNLIEWAAKGQDGTVTMAILPDSISDSLKRNLQVVFDDQTGTLVLLWTEDGSYSQVRVGTYSAGAWKTAWLLPSQGISRAYNPRMLVTHQPVFWLDDTGTPQTKMSSILSIVWWEEALVGQARLANLFLDEQSFDPANLTIYDLPALTGGGGPVSYDGIPGGAYLYPSLQADGLSGVVLASFADLNAQKQRVLRLQYPINWGKPTDPDPDSTNSVNWKRRHIPIVGVAAEGGVPRMVPEALSTRDGVRTTIGRGYTPTLSWGNPDASSVNYTRWNGTDWDPVRSIAIDDTMTYEHALALVSGMAQRN